MKSNVSINDPEASYNPNAIEAMEEIRRSARFEWKQCFSVRFGRKCYQKPVFLLWNVEKRKFLIFHSNYSNYSVWYQNNLKKMVQITSVPIATDLINCTENDQRQSWNNECALKAKKSIQNKFKIDLLISSQVDLIHWTSLTTSVYRGRVTWCCHLAIDKNRPECWF